MSLSKVIIRNGMTINLKVLTKINVLDVDTERKSKDKILTLQSGKVVFEISANKYIDIQSEIKRLSQKN